MLLVTENITFHHKKLFPFVRVSNDTCMLLAVLSLPELKRWKLPIPLPLPQRWLVRRGIEIVTKNWLRNARGIGIARYFCFHFLIPTNSAAVSFVTLYFDCYSYSQKNFVMYSYSFFGVRVSTPFWSNGRHCSAVRRCAIFISSFVYTSLWFIMSSLMTFLLISIRHTQFFSLFKNINHYFSIFSKN